MRKNHYKRMEQIYLIAPYNVALYDETSIVISEGRAEISTRVCPRHHHGAGAMHGSAYFRMLDDAAFFAVNSTIEDLMVYTVSFHTQFLRPVQKGIIKAIGELKHSSRNLFIGESSLYDEKGKLVALGRGEFMKSSIDVRTIPGYTD
ncbi:MAG: thioesterase [Firmicutes bacterium HGW-Firmicutes-15]|nr:MAG: thioesterase [Firmicutes bacterium HGW-Firmicutes-15]